MVSVLQLARTNVCLSIRFVYIPIVVSQLRVQHNPNLHVLSLYFTSDSQAIRGIAIDGWHRAFHTNT